MSPVTLYAGVGILIGLIVTKIVVDPAGTSDFLIGAVFGFVLGGAIAISKGMLRKSK